MSYQTKQDFQQQIQIVQPESWSLGNRDSSPSPATSSSPYTGAQSDWLASDNASPDVKESDSTSTIDMSVQISNETLMKYGSMWSLSNATEKTLFQTYGIIDMTIVFFTASQARNEKSSDGIFWPFVEQEIGFHLSISFDSAPEKNDDEFIRSICTFLDGIAGDMCIQPSGEESFVKLHQGAVFEKDGLNYLYYHAPNGSQNFPSLVFPTHSRSTWPFLSIDSKSPASFLISTEMGNNFESNPSLQSWMLKIQSGMTEPDLKVQFSEVYQFQSTPSLGIKAWLTAGHDFKLTRSRSQPLEILVVESSGGCSSITFPHDSRNQLLHVSNRHFEGNYSKGFFKYEILSNRGMHSAIDFPNGSKIDEIVPDICIMLHSPDTFADPFEIARITYPKGLSIACHGKPDVELPAYDAGAKQNVLVSWWGQETIAPAFFMVPFHLRYHRTQEQIGKVAISAPRIWGYVISKAWSMSLFDFLPCWEHVLVPEYKANLEERKLRQRHVSNSWPIYRWKEMRSNFTDNLDLNSFIPIRGKGRLIHASASGSMIVPGSDSAAFLWVPVGNSHDSISILWMTFLLNGLGIVFICRALYRRDRFLSLARPLKQKPS